MDLWHWLTTSRHTRWLEGEVERLRTERDEGRRQVWAMVNSLVTTAGAPLPQEFLQQARAKTEGAQEARPTAQRGRKSWHQRAMALEIESARALQNALHRKEGPRKSTATASESRAGSDRSQAKGE